MRMASIIKQKSGVWESYSCLSFVTFKWRVIAFTKSIRFHLDIFQATFAYVFFKQEKKKRLVRFGHNFGPTRRRWTFQSHSWIHNLLGFEYRNLPQAPPPFSASVKLSIRLPYRTTCGSRIFQAKNISPTRRKCR